MEKVGSMKKKKDGGNKQGAGRNRANNIMETQGQIQKEETKCEGGREVLPEHLVTAEPTRTLLSSPGANWPIQCENSSLCTHPLRHTAHKRVSTAQTQTYSGQKAKII